MREVSEDDVEGVRHWLDAEADVRRLARRRERLERRAAALSVAIERVLGRARRGLARTVAATRAVSTRLTLARLGCGGEPPDGVRLARRLRPLRPPTAARWWSDACHAERARLARAMPTVLGGLVGIDPTTRDAANRDVLARRIDQLGGDLATASPEQAAALRDERRSYRRILAAVSGRGASRPALLHLDTLRAPPLASIAVGDVARAGHVTFLVPGMGWTSDGATGWTVAARNLLAAQQHLAPAVEHAVVAWIGYETPDRETVRWDEHACAGGELLAAEIRALRAWRGPECAVSVVAHSYGSAVAVRALADADALGAVRALVCLGSAGVESDLGGRAALAADTVLAGEAPPPTLPFLDGGGDCWATVGRAVSGRVDPREPGFGAEPLDIGGAASDGGGARDADGGAPVLAHGAVPRAEGRPWHGYLDAGSAALEAAARATVAGLR